MNDTYIIDINVKRPPILALNPSWNGNQYPIQPHTQLSTPTYTNQVSISSKAVLIDGDNFVRSLEPHHVMSCDWHDPPQLQVHNVTYMYTYMYGYNNADYLILYVDIYFVFRWLDESNFQSIKTSTTQRADALSIHSLARSRAGGKIKWLGLALEAYLLPSNHHASDCHNVHIHSPPTKYMY